MKHLAGFFWLALYVLLLQAAFRWPGSQGGALEAAASLLLPALLAREISLGRRWYALWACLFVGIMLLTIWMPPTIASKGGIPKVLSWFAGLLLWAYDSLPPLLALLAAGSIWKKAPGWRGVAAAACAAALVMVVCDTWLLHVYPWTWATALASPPFFGRAAAFLGTEGLTALVWVHGVIAGRFLALGHAKRAAITTASALVFVLSLSGAWYLLPRGSELAIDVAIIQPNYPVNTRVPHQLGDMWQRSDSLLREKRLPLSDRPTLLLWPESSVTDGNYLSPDLELGEISRSRGVAWLFGTDGWLDRYTPLNIVRGEVAGQKPFFQAKVIPMPFGERMPGPAWMRGRLERIAGFKSWEVGELGVESSFHVPTKDGGQIVVHPLICSEALIPGRVRAGLVLAGGDLLTEHTNDGWFEKSSAAGLHASMVRLRALESGIPLVRTTMSGRSGWVREDGTWRHVDPGVMTAGEHHFVLKWRPVKTPARTHWPFFSLLLLLMIGLVAFVPPRFKRSGV